MELAAHLLDLEQQLHQRSTRGDSELLAALLADDFFEFGASGTVWGSKTEVIDGLRDEMFAVRSVSEFAVKRLADGVALVTYSCHREATAVAAAGTSLRSSVWRETAGRWQMVFHQGTPLMEQGPG